MAQLWTDNPTPLQAELAAAMDERDAFCAAHASENPDGSHNAAVSRERFRLINLVHEKLDACIAADIEAALARG